MAKDYQKLKLGSFLTSPMGYARLSLSKSMFVSSTNLGLIGIKKAYEAMNGVIPLNTLRKWQFLNHLPKEEKEKGWHKEVIADRKRAVAIKENISLQLSELDSLIENAHDLNEKEALKLIQAQLNKKIDLKQKAISNEVNNKLFRVLEIVEDKLKDDYIPTDELKRLLEILKDISAIVGLIGKTPLIAQQFNNVANNQEDNKDKKIQAIEVEVITNETKD